METRFIIGKCMLRPNEGSSLKEDYDIVRGNPFIDYYESVDSPTIALTVTFFDVDQVVSREGITGGEYIDVTVKITDFNDFEIKSEEHKLMLNSVRNVITETNKQIATLEFLSAESIVNETARVNKKYAGNVTGTVKELLKTDAKGIQTSKNLESDEAANSYAFVGNLKRPLDTIQWLCPKAQSSTKNFGFLFFETLDGYNFKSIEKLLDQDSVRYTHTDRPMEGSFKIMQNNLNQTNDIGMNLRLGMYANRTTYVDIENQNVDIVDFDITQLDLKKPVKLLDGIEKHPTRLMLRVNDYGVSQKGSKKEDTVPESELAVYQNKSYIRNNVLFSQSLQISIPINPDLRAGNVIDVRLPVEKGDGSSGESEQGNEKSNDPSG